MKYILYCTAALVICFIAALLISKGVLKKIKKKTGKSTTITTIVVCVLLYCMVALGYLSAYYHADADAVNKAFAMPNISVTQCADGGSKAYSFTKEGNDCALIFYAGAKVDELAYSPLMAELADGGVDCYLVKIPFHMAMFAADAPDWLLQKFSDKNYDVWMVGGHSMGGIVAAQYAAKHSDVIDGIVLLASYSTASIPQNISLCSIYGSNDGCLDLKEYESNKENFPAVSEEYIIDGGNHAQFASYGMQRGDGIAKISPENQVSETSKIVCCFAKSIR